MSQITVFTLLPERPVSVTSEVVVNDTRIPPAVWRAVLGAALELTAAKAAWPIPFHNAHEAYGVIAEEWKELQDHIFTNQKRRDLPEMRKEAIQLAAMALRFVVEICDDDKGRA